MLVKEFSAKSEQEAIELALTELNLKEEQVRIEIVENTSGNDDTLIRVYYDEISTFVGTIEETVKQITLGMGIDVKVEAYEESDKKIYVNIMAEDDAAILIGRKGSTLDSIQFIVSLIAIKILGEDSEYHVLVDVAGYRNKREQTLRDLAFYTASQVKRYKKAKFLEPMNPYERRIIHLALQDDNEIETKSDGDGIYKKVRVFLAKGGYNNNQRQNNFNRYNSDYR